MTARRDLTVATAIALVAAALFIPLIELPPDTAYYLLWSRHPDLAYLDHPPAVAAPFFWVPDAALLTAARVAALICGLLNALLIVLVLRAASTSQLSIPILLSVILAPLSLAGLLLWTPDLPLLLGWHLGLYCLLTRRAPWVLVPCALLMASSKIVGPALVGLWLLTWHPRPRFRIPIAVSLAAACLVLVLTGGPSLEFQLGRAESPSLRLLGPLEVLAGQLAVLGPILACVGIASLRGADDTAFPWRRLVLGCALPFLAWSLITPVEANWLAPAALPLLAVTVRASHSPRTWAWIAGSHIVLGLVLALQLAAAPLSLGRADPTRALRGWSQWSQRFPQGSATLILSDRYQQGSQLAIRQAVASASFDAIDAGAALRPSALDSRVDASAHRVVLLVWSEKSPSAALRERWPVLLEHGEVGAHEVWGAPEVTHWELRALSPSEWPR